MKRRLFPLLATGVVTLRLVQPALADTIYSNFQNITIPTDFTGVFLDIDAVNPIVPANQSGWDINPFFAGQGIANSAAFQPVRIGAGNLDRVLNLAPGTVISGSLTYASGFGGSGNPNAHIGAGADLFQDGTEGYLGFKFTKNGGGSTLYGWMRVTLALNGGVAAIKDWGYDDAGGTIAVGRVQQSAAVANAQTVTLSPGTGESFTLGSAITDTGGNVNSVLKTGAGSTKLTTANTFTGTTAVDGGTLEAGAANVLGQTASVAVNTGGTLLLSGTGDRIRDAAGITLNGGTFNTAGLSETVGALTLSASSIIDFGANASANSLIFAQSAGSWTGTLSIYNWTGAPFIGGGPDHLFFGSNNSGLNTNQLSQISFYSGAGTGFLGTGGFLGSSGELVPVPEASSLVVAMGLLGVVGWRERRRELQVRRATRRALV